MSALTVRRSVMQATGTGYARQVEARRYPRNASDIPQCLRLLFIAGRGQHRASGARSEAAGEVQSRLKVTAAEGVRRAAVSPISADHRVGMDVHPELRRGAVCAVYRSGALRRAILWAVISDRGAATSEARTFVDFFERSFNPD